MQSNWVPLVHPSHSSWHNKQCFALTYSPSSQLPAHAPSLKATLHSERLVGPGPLQIVHCLNDALEGWHCSWQSSQNCVGKGNGSTGSNGKFRFMLKI